MKENSEITKNPAPLFQQVSEVIEYVHNQRIFLIGQPLLSRFKDLINGYDKINYAEVLKKKLTR
ncbi:hypothetical protein [Emticicia sp. 21SJ11W-3]|uniref:hypothetical protein n=1 Tax=Emticicia sp. 21SJ11W-3 TaxID=2916755 RepID=UPI00209F2FBD|nr:hypothetical protein [Emticicia sp. 21SJ11W-3]UTA70218.1 hypothetical protein MB380_10425 [Emticicia sp. 21SJ11W-3]